MDFKELKKKYSPDSGPVREEPSVVSPAPKPERPAPKPPAAKPARPVAAKPAGYKPAAGKVTPPKPVRTTETEDFPSVEGFFDGGAPAPAGRTRPGFSRGSMAVLPWVDIIMILLTIAGVIWVIANFDAVTLIIAAAIGRLLQSLVGLLFLVGSIVGLVGLVLFLTRRRRFW